MSDDARTVAEEVVGRLERAWNAGDGAAFGAPFTDDADFVAIRGDHHRSRAAIAAGHQGIFDGIYRGSTLRHQVTQARRLADDVILAHSTQELDAPSGPLAGTHRSTSTLVLVHTAQGWRIAAFHNTLVQDQPGGEPPSSGPE